MRKTKRYTVKYGVRENGISTWHERGAIGRKRDAIAIASKFWNKYYGYGNPDKWLRKPTVYRTENDGSQSVVMIIGND